MSISDLDYNTARTILINAGSATANASHTRHTQGTGSPLIYGQTLLREARDEFRVMDAGLPALFSGMTEAHFDAIHDAAGTMGIDRW